TIQTDGTPLNGGTGANGGNGANLTADPTNPTREVIDWTEDYSSVPTGYKMKYVACGDGGRQETYEVRWDVITMSTYARMVLISARPAGIPQSQANAGLRFVIPITLRSIDGA